MIPAILILALAFGWLLYETNFMRVRLPVGSKPANKTLLLTQGEVKPQPLLLDTVHYKPSQFEPLDMPEFTGSLNIVCKRC
jgi:hypothetical protein